MDLGGCLNCMKTFCLLCLSESKICIYNEHKIVSYSQYNESVKKMEEENNKFEKEIEKIKSNKELILGMEEQLRAELSASEIDEAKARNSIKSLLLRLLQNNLRNFFLF